MLKIQMGLPMSSLVSLYIDFSFFTVEGAVFHESLLLTLEFFGGRKEEEEFFSDPFGMKI